MFATLLGALPRPTVDRTLDGVSDDELVVAAIEAQDAAGLEPITDGRLRGEPDIMAGDPEGIVAAWRFAAAQTRRAVKQALPGPYSIGWGPGADPSLRASAVLRASEAIRKVVEALAMAGCPLIEIEETRAHLIGGSEAERGLFADAHRVLAADAGGTHLSLSIVGGSAWAAGLETILAAPYASLAVDLIDGPDNWNLVTRLPGDRGVIAGALPARKSPAEAKEMLVWAARYAAASQRRGLDRVGIGSAGSWSDLTWAAAVEKMQRLGGAARVAQISGGARLARELDPRAVRARRAARGHRPRLGNEHRDEPPRAT